MQELLYSYFKSMTPLELLPVGEIVPEALVIHNVHAPETVIINGQRQYPAPGETADICINTLQPVTETSEGWVVLSETPLKVDRCIEKEFGAAA